MVRLLVTWRQPQHLSSAEAWSWLRSQSARLLELPDIARLELTQLETPSEKRARTCDWLLVVHLAAGRESAACVDDPVFAEWLRDLHLLGMRPAVVLADRTVVLEREQD